MGELLAHGTAYRSLSTPLQSFEQMQEFPHRRRNARNARDSRLIFRGGISVDADFSFYII